MPTAWIISPVIETVAPLGSPSGTRRFRVPKVRLIEDPGRPLIDGARSHYDYSSVITEQQTDTNGDWCLSLIRGIDLSVLESDPDITIIHIKGEGLNTKLQDLPAAKRAKIRAAVQSKRGNIADLRDDMQIWEWIVEVGKLIKPEFKDTRGMWFK
ncbi:MAG: hypothetical protein IH874_03885 [Candidatus Dadabacteria bacterium]|nr:hypothetical protein [Candidatus Dadabacteria bacterium]